MKTRIGIIVLILLFIINLSANPISEDCKLKGKKLYGLVRIVQYVSPADFAVRTVNIGADLRVETVSHNPFKCGQWRIVQAGEDFTIQFVQAGEDFTIEFDSMTPGRR